MKIISALILCIFISACNNIDTPLEKNNYNRITTHDELLDYIRDVSKTSAIFRLKIFEGKKIPLIFVSEDNFRDKNKLTVLLFAQQHGNEPAGKEALLLLLKEFARGGGRHLLANMNLLIFPSLNPYGNDNNTRRNDNDFDLNRNHLILSQAETKILHKLFSEYLPEAALDMHEYNPYGKDWLEYGFRKNFDVQLGTLTNPNISRKIIDLQKNEVIPYIKTSLNKQGFSFNEYILGGPPKIRRMRFSTIDIDDGRQSFGMLGTFSMILEGMNSLDQIQEINRRSKAQLAAVLAFLEYLSDNSALIKKIVLEERRNLSLNNNLRTAIRMEHTKLKDNLSLSLLSIKTGMDTTININNFHDSIAVKHFIMPPKGYLVSKSDSLLLDFLRNHSIHYQEIRNDIYGQIYKYIIIGKQLSIDEELENDFYKVEKVRINDVDNSLYYFVPTAQLYSHFLVTAFEPQSQIGLVQYDNYKLIVDGEYQILRVE